MNQLQTLKNSIDVKTVTSVVVGMAAFGAITYFAVASGVKPLKKAVKIVQGDK